MAEALEKAQAIYDTELVSSYLDGRDEGRAEGEARGRAEGRAEGEASGIVKTARAMLSDGMLPDIIAKYTGLSREQILAL